jgi:hypothetical protein
MNEIRPTVRALARCTYIQVQINGIYSYLGGGEYENVSMIRNPEMDFLHNHITFSYMHRRTQISYKFVSLLKHNALKEYGGGEVRVSRVPNLSCLCDFPNIVVLGVHFIHINMLLITLIKLEYPYCSSLTCDTVYFRRWVPKR